MSSHDFFEACVIASYLRYPVSICYHGKVLLVRRDSFQHYCLPTVHGGWKQEVTIKHTDTNTNMLWTHHTTLTGFGKLKLVEALLCNLSLRVFKSIDWDPVYWLTITHLLHVHVIRGFDWHNHDLRGRVGPRWRFKFYIRINAENIWRSSNRLLVQERNGSCESIFKKKIFA